MLISEIKTVLKAEACCGDELLANRVSSACGSDMMSDVLAFVKDQAVLLTGLVNTQTIRTAAMMDMSCVVFVRGKRPTEEMCSMAAELKIALLATELTMFQACGLLYQAGLGR
jgi:predicted transcriptional regulator